ncbi:hypothetical protein [Cellulophaga lytica]|uniref:Lipoprotein n=1 Tax=Cellulophaga lytica (strain ATCC 23178 / DSM 7489 / JCM 8516 / NBRC 14961 / NCIMB 1423 / VKM B-1433 / Cy l20) TaxID=867900 RepID=F0RB93_CELLC|nr:hypothetical protein [Cellulophaga lytica]ADY28495.1 hypothetical protein Celly_0660 [Cellulophaga lytica DSM 7489]AIM59550.1 hypothetical protein IX49_03055 [Cellulophaga lytica]WQG77330.1 hypothetical protein SR888_00030 [Cellulophaga lytica]
MKKAIILLAIIIQSCNNKAAKKHVISSNTEQEKSNSVNKEIADLPLQIDSITSQILIHPIISISANSKNYLNRSSYKNDNITNDRIIHHNDVITGNIVNLKFQAINSNKLISLSSKDILINSITFLRDTYKKTTKEILLYSVIDTDTNNDKQINQKDQSTLYISYIDGSYFKRISITNKDIIHHYKFTLDNQKLYFNTLVNTNKDNTLNTQDSIYYGYIDLLSNNLNIIPYTPI